MGGRPFLLPPSPRGILPSMPKPLIGVTTDYNTPADGQRGPGGPSRSTRSSVNIAYTAAVEAAGGVPVVLPFYATAADAAEVVARLDGILFTGGDDLNPAAWGETYHPSTEPVDPRREQSERWLMTAADRRDLPTLCICLGMQLLNVVRGGSMHQFIPELKLAGALEHRKLNHPERRHPVKVESGTVLHGVVGHTEVDANSSHKQAVNRVGAHLKVSAVSPDGVVEAVEDPTRSLCLGVQWHPERLDTEAPHASLFDLLVQRATAFAARGRSR